ncbi:unnamed protein product [Brassica rapa]|uniref:Uncharacterized protein n=2 Tax=Brassica TaxID=3705 RepID=A0A8D9MBD4_BRACM|nr:unnamed protein product [Brassica napus]CAG7905588.1 unnamed protein product [Brassica rapa]
MEKIYFIFSLFRTRFFFLHPLPSMTVLPNVHLI